MKVIFSSQFRDSSGYASAARSYLEAIDKVIHKYEYDFRILSIAVEQASAISHKQEGLISKYEIDLSQVDDYIKEDYLLIWHQPAGMVMFGDQNLGKDPKWIAFKKLLDNSTKNINMTVWESNKIPDFWNSIHKRYKTISTIVPCKWNQETFSKSGLRSHCLPHVITDNIVDPKPIPGMPINLDEKFTVFSMSQWIQRKGFDALVKAYCMEFNNNPDAILLIKTYVDTMNVARYGFKEQAKVVQRDVVNIKKSIFKGGRPSTASIMVLCDLLPYENISWLYSKSDVFALATRGEGFGLTISEAIMHEKPVIVPDFGGHTDYIDKDNNFLFEGYDHPYTGDPTYDYDMNWYEPDINDLRGKLREAYGLWKTNRKEFKNRGVKSKEYIKKSGYDLESIGDSFFAIINEELRGPRHSLKEQIRSFSSNSKKIDLLKDKFKIKDCYILTCGPSLKQYSPDFLREKLKDKLVFAVKQAYNYVPEIVDFHFFNVNNFEVYDYDKSDPIVITNSAENELACIHHTWSNKQHYDIFTFTKDDKDFSKSICKSLKFEDYLFENTMDRPWGPGMMTELVLYTAIHLGVKNIYTIGWDLESPGTTKSSHFYEDRSLIRPADPMKQEEIKLNIDTTKHLYEWLKSKDIGLFVANSNSYVHKTVPRRLLK